MIGKFKLNTKYEIDMNHFNKYLIIGNGFSAVSNHMKILTYSELLTNIHNRKIFNACLHVEQGVSEKQVSWLKQLLKKYHMNNEISVVSYFDKFQRCPGALNHKVFNYNTLISTPKKINQSHYYSVLMIDDRCAEMSDHTSGQHIQMMVLIEAARQMVLAVTEKFFIDSSMRSKLSFVANSIESTFSQFIFPFSTEMHCYILKQRILQGNNITNFLKIEFMQNKTFCAEIRMNSSALTKDFLKNKENAMVSLVSRTYLQALENEIIDLSMVVNNG